MQNVAIFAMERRNMRRNKPVRKIETVRQAQFAYFLDMLVMSNRTCGKVAEYYRRRAAAAREDYHMLMRKDGDL